MSAATTPQLLATCWTTAGAAGPLIGNDLSEHPIIERIRHAAEAGYRGFGLLHDDLLVAEKTIGWATLRDALADHGMTVLEIEMLNDWFLAGPTRGRSDEVRGYLLRAAEFFGPRHLKVGGDITGRTFPLDLIAEEFSALCDAFGQAGCAVAYELMPFGNLRTIADGAALLDAAAHPNGGLMLDLWHIARSPSSFDEIRSLPPRYVLAVELDDADEQVRGTLLEDTLHHRRLCGDGAQDVAGFVAAVRATGFSGPWGVEIISDEHRRRPLAEQAALSYRSAASYLRGTAPPQERSA